MPRSDSIAGDDYCNGRDSLIGACCCLLVSGACVRAGARARAHAHTTRAHVVRVAVVVRVCVVCTRACVRASVRASVSVSVWRVCARLSVCV